MTRKRKVCHENKIDTIFRELSSNFEALFQELHSKLKNEKSYKRLKGVGELQFFNAAAECSQMESQNTRIDLAKINMFAIEVEKEIDAIIHEKFQSSFQNTLKNEVLKVILKLYSKEKGALQGTSENGVLSPNENSEVKIGKDEEEGIHKKLEEISKSGAESLNVIRKEVINMPVEHFSTTENHNETLSRENNLETLEVDNGKSKERNDSFGSVSVSSVHTSELSSFDDDIVFSSDEEAGEKTKRIAWKAAEEKLNELKAEKLSTPKKGQNQAKTTKHVDATKSENPKEEFSSVKTLPQRVRKPNSRYANDVLSPLKKISSEKTATSSPASVDDNLTSRKRGRPKKYVT